MRKGREKGLRRLGTSNEEKNGEGVEKTGNGK